MLSKKQWYHHVRYVAPCALPACTQRKINNAGMHLMQVRMCTLKAICSSITTFHCCSDARRRLRDFLSLVCRRFTSVACSPMHASKSRPFGELARHSRIVSRSLVHVTSPESDCDVFPTFSFTSFSAVDSNLTYLSYRSNTYMYTHTHISYTLHTTAAIHYNLHVCIVQKYLCCLKIFNLLLLLQLKCGLQCL